MKLFSTRWSVVFSVAALTGLAGVAEVASGQMAGTSPRDNAALWYLTGNTFAGEETPAEAALLKDFAVVPTDEAVGVIEGSEAQLAYLRRGAALPAAVWAIDFEENGPEQLLPHLPILRDLMKRAGLRGRWSLDQGDPQAAVEDWLAAIRMSRHAADDGTLVGALVQFSIESAIVEMLATNLHRLDRDTLTALRSELREVPPRRRLVASVASERPMVVWLQRKLNELDIEEAMTQLEWFGLDHAETRAIAEALDDSDEPRALVDGWIQGMGRWYDAVEGVFAAPLAEQPAASKTFEANLAATDNLLAQAILPGVGAAYPYEARCRVRWAMLDAAIEWRLDGGPGTVVNPATGQLFPRRVEDGQLVLESPMLDLDGEPMTLPFSAEVDTPLAR